MRRRRKKRNWFWIGILSIFALGMMVLLFWRNQHIEVKLVAYEPPAHPYLLEQFQLKDERYTYQDEDYQGVTGIDVSVHQKDIDWEKVAQDGIEFALIRIGYRGYQLGEIHLDPQFQTNFQQAHKNGLAVGVYFFSQATTLEEAKEEAMFVGKTLQGATLDFPVVYDLEIAHEQGRINSLSKLERTKNAIAFITTMKQLGYSSMIYGSTDTLDQLYVMKYLTKYPLWIAEYDQKVRYPYEFLIWQYTSNGHVEGITTRVDLNLWMVPR